MLSVSSAWKAMFKGNVVSEALIKFVVEDYGTLYKTDIFSYSFKGNVSTITKEYPNYSATLKLVMKNDYKTFSNFYGKYVDVYYGFKINGSDEYVKAIRLYIDDIDVSDDGRTATWFLKSILAYLTDTPSIALPNEEAVIDNFPFSDFVSNYMSAYSTHIGGSNDYYYRSFPSKITLGEALQKLCFVNCKTLYLDSTNTIQMVEKNYNPTYILDEINLVNYPHITRGDIFNNVDVDWLDLSDTNLEITNVGVYELTTTGSGGVFNKQQTTNLSQKSLLILTEACYAQKISGTGALTGYTITSNKNDKTTMGVSSSTNNNTFNFYLGGYQYSDFVKTQNGYTSVFDININSQAQANKIKTWLTNYLSDNRRIELKMRFDPSIELQDVVLTSKAKRFVVEEMQLDFKGSYQGTIKGKYLGTYALKPIVSNVYWEADQQGDLEHYGFDVENPNPFKVILHIRFSSSREIYKVIDGNTGVHYNEDDIGDMYASFEEKMNGQLSDEAYCYFNETFEGAVSQNTIILSSDY